MLRRYATFSILSNSCGSCDVMAILAVSVAETCKGLLGSADNADGASLALLLPVDFGRAVESSSSERSALHSQTTEALSCDQVCLS